ncbi:MAG TPA: Hsp20/alpha crystallin family protein [Noviherbaspirillum sp.]
MANQLSRLNPFRDIARFDPFQGFDDFFKDLQWRPAMRGMDVEPRIKMDVTENDKGYAVKAEIPGVSKDDIKVNVKGNEVSISVEVNKEKEEKEGDTVIHSERYVGRQYRSFTLPVEIDEGKVEARYLDGVLDLRLPKRAGDSGAKQISIS